MARFSDLPLQEPPREEIFYGYFPAKYVTSYLESYVDQPRAGGTTIRQKILFNSKVDHIDYSSTIQQWTTRYSIEGNSRSLQSPKLVIAAGLTSRPNTPALAGRDVFEGSSIHHVDFASSSILSDEQVRHIAVMGGAKSAADVAYAAAKAGKRVSWIIRRSGSGPAHMVAAKGNGPYRNSNESLYNQLAASLTPSIWNGYNKLSNFLHRTGFGRFMVGWIWRAADADLRRSANYHGRDKQDGRVNGFANLEPDTSYVNHSPSLPGCSC